MKSKNILMAGMLLMLPATVTAQKHIQQAFDALRQSDSQKEVHQRYSVEKDPDTGKMEGLNDTYDFLIPNNHDKQLIDNILHAFKMDESKAYNVSRGSHGGTENYTALAVGNGSSGGEAIGLMQGSTYIYACFLDPEDTTRTHRYAYALEWVEDDAKIRGRIVKTYATTQKFREGRTRKQSFIVNGKTYSLDGLPSRSLEGLGSSFFFGSGDKSSETWLMEFNTFKNHFLKNPDGTAASSYATQIYKLCKNAKSLDDAERAMVASELQKLKRQTKDDFIRQLFDMSGEHLIK